MDFVKQFPKQCSEIIQLINENKCNSELLSMSNYICEDAETLHFHQEYDSSYTLLSVPIWDMKSFTPKKGEKPNKDKETIDDEDEKKSIKIDMGTANFIFRWTPHSDDDNTHGYFPISMSHGCNILFSGFGCYHRQHKTNKGKFFNYASYQNRQYFHKMRMSVIRSLSMNK